MNKRIKKQFWLSPKDAEELKRKAKLAGVTETAVIRLLIRGYEPREKPDGRFYEAMRNRPLSETTSISLPPERMHWGLLMCRC